MKMIAAAIIAASVVVLVSAGTPGQGSDDGIASVNGSTYIPPRPSPNPGARNLPEHADDVKKVAQQFKGTHDLAGAAEALVAAAGNQFVYSYGDTKDAQRHDPNSIHSMDDLYAQRIMICYEFVHYVAYLASNQRTSGSGAPLMGASAPAAYDTRHYTVWDGKSDIPRGKVIVFVAYAFNNDGGFYHIGISLGHGKIAHNSSSGSVQISNISDVNSIGYKEVRISDYKYHDAPPAPEPESTPAETQTPTPAPTPDQTPATGKPVSMVPGLRDALDAGEQGFRFAGPTTCCGDPAGALYSMPAAKPISRFQTFVTGSPVDEVFDAPVPRQGFLDRYLLRPGPRLVLAAFRPQSAAPEPAGVIPGLRVVATGASTGDAFRLEIIGTDGAVGRLMAPVGLALQPTGSVAPVPAASAGGTIVRDLTGFCAEFGKRPPPPGTVYRVADERIQSQLKPMRQIVRAADRLADAGGLHPDSNAAAYLSATKQWAIWTRAEGWTRSEFIERFVERTKENAKSAGRRWTDDLERQVRGLLPNRWTDVQAVLQAAF